ncbi:MAG: outer membrane lipoprotein-sorting protein [Kiritimatiellia bacterium]|nr:outer membrane lipoprotein-sorting protein [Kiritimatiellia bacterium]
MNPFPFRHGAFLARLAIILIPAFLARGMDEEPWWRNEAPPEGPVILEKMRAAMPEGIVEVRAILLPRGTGGAETSRLEATLMLDWHGNPSRASFEMRRAGSGDFVAGFLVERRTNGVPLYRRIEADGSLVPASPNDFAWDTVFTWRDLAFDYLWWPRAVTAGVEMRRQRRCFLVDLTNPDPEAKEASVRLWVDDSVYALLQAETRDAQGKPLRVVSVKSLRRTGLQWMVEDIEVRDLESGRRTLLRILPPDHGGES